MGDEPRLFLSSGIGATRPIHPEDFKRCVASKFEGYVTRFSPHKAPTSIASCNLTFDERVVVHRVGSDRISFFQGRNLSCQGLWRKMGDWYRKQGFNGEHPSETKLSGG